MVDKLVLNDKDFIPQSQHLFAAGRLHEVTWNRRRSVLSEQLGHELLQHFKKSSHRSRA